MIEEDDDPFSDEALSRLPDGATCGYCKLDVYADLLKFCEKCEKHYCLDYDNTVDDLTCYEMHEEEGCDVHD